MALKENGGAEWTNIDSGVENSESLKLKLGNLVPFHQD